MKLTIDRLRSLVLEEVERLREGDFVDARDRFRDRRLKGDRERFAAATAAIAKNRKDHPNARDGGSEMLDRRHLMYAGNEAPCPDCGTIINFDDEFCPWCASDEVREAFNIDYNPYGDFEEPRVYHGTNYCDKCEGELDAEGECPECFPESEREYERTGNTMIDDLGEGRLLEMVTCPCGVDRQDCTYHYEQHNREVEEHLDEVKEFYVDHYGDMPNEMSSSDLENAIVDISSNLGYDVDVVRDIVYEFGGLNNP